MKKHNLFKALLASLLVTLSLAAPSVLLTTTMPTDLKAMLSFTGAELVRHDDGSYQLLFDVTMDGPHNTFGALFDLSFNSEYIVPSDFDTNAAVQVNGTVSNDSFFRYNPEIAKDVTTGESYDPYQKQFDVIGTTGGMEVQDYSTITMNGAENTLQMRLELDRTVIRFHSTATDTAGLVKVMPDVTDKVNTVYYAFNIEPLKRDDSMDEDDDEDDDVVVAPVEPVVLGQLSFRVQEGKLPEILRYFNGLDKTSRAYPNTGNSNIPHVVTYNINGTKRGSTFLLDVRRDKTKNEDVWKISCYEGSKYNGSPKAYGFGMNAVSNGVADHYEFNFNADQVIAVEATEPDFTINAYQAYSDGSKSDLAIAMGRYSPTITITYADGSQENRAFPWSEDSAQIWNSTGWTSIGSYDPTASVQGSNYLHADKTATGGVFGSDYYFRQKTDLTYTAPDGTTQYFYVTAHMKVTPIHVLDVTAEDLEKTYTVREARENISAPGKLKLPGEAQIITDVVPGNVSLVVDIPGWMPQNYPTSTWPTGSATSDTYMNALKADTYSAPDGTPYWPDGADAGKPETNHIGTYTFVTSDATHTTAQGITKAMIQSAFPWLTVEKNEYALTNAVRHIVSDSDQTYQDYNADRYEAAYVSTVTETATNGAGQPTLTLSLRKKGTAEGDYTSLASGSVFRVWLPNGLELGTGNASGLTTAVDDWFQSNSNGFYKTATQSDSKNNSYFHLITNPNDPADGAAFATERETLRRYINLGGWYAISVCEDPDATEPYWSERIPVYVPPRPNEYTESKVYNFIAANADLMSWPGGVGDTLYLPHGSYAPLSTQNESVGSDVLGLPLYKTTAATTGGTAAGTVLDGTGDATIFRDGDPYDPDYDVVERYTESYGISTLYDGQTGAQPGVVYNVKVNKDITNQTAPWTKSASVGTLSPVVADSTVQVYQYGPTPLYCKSGTNFTVTDASGGTHVITLDGYAIPGYGTVSNPSNAYRATLRRDKGEYDPTDPENPDNEKPAAVEKIKLLSVVDNGITRRDLESVPLGESYRDHRNVALVTFDTQTQGYTVRQEYTLTIKNVGDADIYGLDINSTLDGYADETTGGRFVITKHPASFLPVGAETTFTLTYVYNLTFDAAASYSTSKETVYHDILYITSNSHPNAVYGGENTGIAPANGSAYPTGYPTTNEYLLEFEAEFRVSKDDLHQVTVIYNPPEGHMGTANLIVGESSGAINYAPTTRTYVSGSMVYVVANLEDLYEVFSTSCVIDGTTTAVPYHTYGDGTVASEDVTLVKDGTIVYVFEMPADNVTFTVNFYEPLISKVRLEDLIDFSAPSAATDTDPIGNDLRTSAADNANPALNMPDGTHQYTVWRKTFTDDEKSDAAAWSADAATGNGSDKDYYLMTQGRAMPYSADPEQNGNRFVNTESHYLVVIPYDADLSQIEATIRKLVYHKDYRLTSTSDPNGYNEEITLTVDMNVYDYGVESQLFTSVTPEAVYVNNNSAIGYGDRPAFTDSSAGTSVIAPADGSTTSSIHTSKQFDSPDSGESRYVDVILTATDDPSVVRHYYVEIHRAEKNPRVDMKYGNSPYGMIMNTAWSSTQKEQAKEDFDQSLSFAKVDSTHLPTVVKNTAMENVTYWREAWIRNGGLYEPSTYTGTSGSLTNPGGEPVFDDPTLAAPDYDTVGTPPASDPADGLYSLSYDKEYGEKVAYSYNKNLDKDDFAYFAILSEDFLEPGLNYALDSSGRKVDLSTVTLTAEVTLLDTNAATVDSQVDRFSGTDTAQLDLGSLRTDGYSDKLTYSTSIATSAAGQWPVSSADTDGDGVADSFTLVENIRPGRYLLTYHYLDYDGKTPLSASRPLVILSGVGDANADVSRTSGYTVKADYPAGKQGSDEYAIEDRVTDPLGYTAGGWDATNQAETVYPAANLFKFRVCDANNDRNVNNIDANTVDEAVKKAGATWLRFYDPVHYR